MFNMNEMFKDALKPASVGDALEICTDALARKGVDYTLARSIVEDILNFSQFRNFQFSQAEFEEVMDEKKRTVELISAKLKDLIPFFLNQARAVCGLSSEEEKKVGDMLRVSLEVFLEDPDFVKSTDDLAEKFKPILNYLKNRREEG